MDQISHRAAVEAGYADLKGYIEKWGDQHMASVKKGTMTRSPQWWKHLRDWKRKFWKKERKAHKHDITVKSRDPRRDA